MARIFRHAPPGAVLHVISRFIERRFLLDVPHARAAYLAALGRAIERTDWKALAYVLMSSHVHLCLVAGRDPFERLFRSAHGTFARGLNASLDRIGPVFAGRPKSLPVAPASVGRVVAYIHNNPVRAGTVTDAGHSTWSSHGAYVGSRPAPSWLDVGAGLDACGFEPASGASGRFDAFVRAERAAVRGDLTAPDDVDAFARDVAARFVAPVRVGAAEADPVARTIGAVVEARDGASRAMRWAGRPADVIDVAAQLLGVPCEVLQSASRVRHVTAARAIVLRAWVVGLGGRQAAMAEALGLTRSAASRLLSDRRHTQALGRLAERIAQECWASEGSAPPPT